MIDREMIKTSFSAVKAPDDTVERVLEKMDKQKYIKKGGFTIALAAVLVLAIGSMGVFATKLMSGNWNLFEISAKPAAETPAEENTAAGDKGESKHFKINLPLLRFAESPAAGSAEATGSAAANDGKSADAPGAAAADNESLQNPDAEGASSGNNYGTLGGYKISFPFSDAALFDGRALRHDGMDIAAEKGTPVLAAADGTVLEADYSPAEGYYIVLQHEDGYSTKYCHLQETEVEPGQIVKKGEHIGSVGSTGMSTGPHLHFELQEDGQVVDPAEYFESSLE